MPNTISYIPSHRAERAASVGMVDVMSSLILGGMLVAAVAWRRIHVRRAVAAAEAEAVGHTLRPGVSVVSGQVAMEDDSDESAVSIEIDQLGNEWKAKHSWRVTWQECARRVKTRPFYIVRSDGERVRVEPNDKVFLVDQLDGEVRQPGAALRTRTARLTPGENVYASGVLVRGNDPQAGGYRDGGIGWVLRPPPSGKMLISTEPQSNRHTRRARFHRGWITAIVICIALVHGGLFGAFHCLELFGSVVDADVKHTSTYRVWVKPRHGAGYWRTHYVLDAAYTDPAGQSHGVKDEISRALYTSLQRDSRADDTPVQSVPFRVVPSLGLAQVGPAATADDWKIIVTFLICCMLLPLYAATVRRSRPWYDKRRVVDIVNGRL